MFLRRAAPALAKRVALRQPVLQRSFAASAQKLGGGHGHSEPPPMGSLKPFEEIKNENDLLPPGAKPGTIPTDIEQATGLERLEILGKMQGIDIFDMRPLDASRKGTMEDPIVVKSYGDEQYVGCTGCPADSHVVIWLTISRQRDIERCPECGSAYKMEYVGPADDGHGHDHGHDHHDPSMPEAGEPITMADFVRPEYR